MCVEHHRAGGRGDQQRAGQLEREQVVGEQQLGDRADRAAVGHRVGPARPTGTACSARSSPVTSSATNPMPMTVRDDPLLAQHLERRVAGVPAGQHQHEQEQHHDRAGVDDDLHEPEELGVLRDVQAAQAQHGQHQPERRVHRDPWRTPCRPRRAAPAAPGSRRRSARRRSRPARRRRPPRRSRRPARSDDRRPAASAGRGTGLVPAACASDWSAPADRRSPAAGRPAAVRVRGRSSRARRRAASDAAAAPCPGSSGASSMSLV